MVAPLAACAVRSARADDAAVLAVLCAEHARYERANCDGDGHAERLARALSPTQKPARLQAWLAEVDGAIVGYASAALEFSTWSASDYVHMDCLFVRAPARGRGVGATLLQAVVAFARGQGVAAVEWQTPDWNLDAARFYRRAGAVERAKLRFRLAVAEPALRS